jgi:malonyl-CoA O-methyltransferase
MMAFAMPARDSLIEWRTAHRAATGIESAIPTYPSPSELAAMAPAGWSVRIEQEHFREPHGDARGFLAALRAIGAHRPRDPRPPLPPAALRCVMAAFDEAGARSTWQVAYALFGPSPESVREPRN